METIFIIFIGIFATVGFFGSIKWMYDSIKSKIDIRSIAENVKNDLVQLCYNRTTETGSRLKALEDQEIVRRLQGVEEKANNFDRDMNKYHSEIGKDISEKITAALEMYTCAYGDPKRLKKGLANAFKWIAKLEGKILDFEDTLKVHAESLHTIRTRLDKLEKSDKSAYDLQLIDARLISALEKRCDKLENPKK